MSNQTNIEKIGQDKKNKIRSTIDHPIQQALK